MSFFDWIRDFFSPEDSGSFKATLTKTAGGLTVDQFVDQGPTPGNVAVCMSGGGSRALTAGMGQLRALKHLTTSDGKSLLGQAKLISTVSGGSWLGVPFSYLTPDTSDDDYLNRYVEDPSKLVPTKTAGHDVAETLDELPDGNIGKPITSRLFGPVEIAIQMLLLHKFGDVPVPMLWQTAIALHILKPYDLYDPGKDFVPTNFFTYDQKTLDAILAANPQLEREGANLIANGSSRVRRPFLVCNFAMFVKEPGEDFQLLVPVESTSFMTGIVGRPEGQDGNGQQPGGGGVTSFAFSSNPTAVNGDNVTVTQERQLALLDIVGTSSAFFAEILQNLIAGWMEDREKFFEDIDAVHEDLVEWVDKVLPDSFLKKVLGFVDRKLLDHLKESREERGEFLEKILDDLLKIRDLVPEYQYWPVPPTISSETQSSRFADGGDLENTGVADALSYDDIDNVIACVNSQVPMVAAAKGVIDADGNEIPGTRVEIPGQIPPLFGYQAYDKEKGYVLYEGDDDPSGREFMHSKVFSPHAFADLIKGFWAASGNKSDPAELKPGEPGVNEKPVNFRQNLEVQENTWFGVSGSPKIQRRVGVLWVNNNRYKEWYNLLQDDVKKILGDFDDIKSYHDFPNYPTIRTHLTATQLNLLAQSTAWSVGNDGSKCEFVKMFEDS